MAWQAASVLKERGSVVLGAGVKIPTDGSSCFWQVFLGQRYQG